LARAPRLEREALSCVVRHERPGGKPQFDDRDVPRVDERVISKIKDLEVEPRLPINALVVHVANTPMRKTHARPAGEHVVTTDQIGSIIELAQDR
jgi:hypothetical protein